MKPRRSGTLPRARRALPCSLLALALVSPALAGGEKGGLDAALDAIRPEEIRADVRFLSDDEMRGRDTPSRELDIAAGYLRARLERLGFEPAGSEGYFFAYPLELRRLAVPPSVVEIRGTGEALELTFGRDVFLDSLRALVESDRKGGLVFCGTGESAEFPDEGIAGRWAVCFDSALSGVRRRRHAEKAGAIGLVVLTPPPSMQDPFPQRYGRTAELLAHGLVSYPGAARSSARKRFPRLYLDRDASRRLLERSPERGGIAVEAWSPSPGLDLGLTLLDRREIARDARALDVCGLWRGADPELQNQVILVSAHYDHVGVRRGEVYNGADDNGSGSSALLALAEALRTRGALRRSVLLIWVSGEEKGLWGSRAWADAPSLPEGMRAVCDLNIDMVGRNAPGELYVTPTAALEEHYNGLVRLAERLAPSEGFAELKSADAYYDRSDHREFARLGIPVAFLFAGEHEDYHRPGDTVDKIDADKIRRVARLVMRMIDALQTDELEL